VEASINNGVGWDLVALKGDVNSADVSELGEILQRFLTVGRHNVILDLAEVGYIGSAGLSLLIRYTNAFRRWEQGDLHLATLSDEIHNLLQVTGLISEKRSRLSIYPSVDAAKEAAEKRIS